MIQYQHTLRKTASPNVPAALRISLVNDGAGQLFLLNLAMFCNATNPIRPVSFSIRVKLQRQGVRLGL